MRTILVLLACLNICTILHSQERKIPFNGILTDLTDTPIKKARIYISSPGSYSTTDKLGLFGLTNVQPDDTLHILVKKETYRVAVGGMRSMEIRLDTQAGKILVNESRELIEKGFDHVRRRERNLGDIISGESLRRSGRGNLLEALQGKVPGLNISKDGAPGSEGEVNIRGLKSFISDSTPLFVVDGFIVETLNDVPIYDIDYVEILKDGHMYGARGANGVILVFTHLP